MQDVPLTTEARCGIEDLVTEFFWSLDHDAIAEAAQMFTQDAWLDMGVADRPRVQGPAGVAEMFRVRPAGRVVRHHWFNLRPTASDGDVHASFQFTTYTGKADEVGPPAAVVIGEVDAHFRQDAADGRWRFAKMYRTVLFNG